MLTDIALKKLKPKGKIYKVADRDGIRIHVRMLALQSVGNATSVPMWWPVYSWTREV
ncbi:hypothetical protein [Mesorhizobium tamadayense]|uniref:hypothetical protein n=1 Tax=Mesorhizobium tamadayense TaxID=425306 RepID=UPI001FDF576C|nr:hypothetical protein [Mesorhizobium tamadayense]